MKQLKIILLLTILKPHGGAVLKEIIIKSHGVQTNTDPRKTLIWKKTLPWELFDVFEKTQTKNCYRKVFHHGQNYSNRVY